MQIFLITYYYFFISNILKILNKRALTNENSMYKSFVRGLIIVTTWRKKKKKNSIFERKFIYCFHGSEKLKNRKTKK